jgi:hypothetical protein
MQETMDFDRRTLEYRLRNNTESDDVGTGFMKVDDDEEESSRELMIVDNDFLQCVVSRILPISENSFDYFSTCTLSIDTLAISAYLDLSPRIM